MEVVMLKMLTVAVCVAMAIITAQAQIPRLEIQYPRPGQDAVSTTTSIVVRAPMEIDARSITVMFPDSEVSGWKRREPTVLVLRDSLAQSVNRSRWYSHAVAGTYNVEEGRTLRWRPRHLLPNTRYRCVVSEVALSANRGGNVCAPVEWTFTTAPDVPRVKRTTLDSESVVSCGRALNVGFTEPIPSPAILSQILKLEASRGGNIWASIPAQMVLAQDRMSATMLPNGAWPVGSELRLGIKMSALTGDAFDDRIKTCIVRNASVVELDVLSDDGREIPVDIRNSIRVDTLLHNGQTLVCSAGGMMPNGWRFLRWDSPTLPSVNGNTSLRLDVTIPCELYTKKTIIRAIVAKTEMLNIVISIDSGGTVDVFDHEGAALAHVTKADTIAVSTNTSRITLVAKPNANYSFGSWNSAMATVNGLTSATITIPTALLNPPGGGIGLGHAIWTPPLSPKFTPLSPYRTELYRLAARISDVDQDPMSNVSTGVSFTSPMDFTDVSEVTRTVCVIANRCWEIIGYHDPAVGPPVWFNKGKAELCIASRLLNPENNVTIFAQRKHIDLRLERVLLGSEDPNNILQERQPHFETRTDVEKRMVVGGRTSWIPLTQIICEQGGQPFARYALRCGDNVRFIVRAAKNRGEEWRWWSRIVRYAIPATESKTDDIGYYTMAVDLDVAQFTSTDCLNNPKDVPEIRVQAAFRQLFGIASIGLRVRSNAIGERSLARFEERWFDPAIYYDLDTDEPRGGRQLEYIPRKGTSIKIKFTLPVDGPSVLAGAIEATSTDNILVTDPQARNLDFTVATGDRGNVNFLPANGQSADIVEFFICDPATKPIKQALHGGIIDLTCSTKLRSVYGEPLRYQHLFALRSMEIPGLGLRLTDASISYDGDWDFLFIKNSGDIYHAMYGGNLATNAALLTQQGFARMPDCGQQQGVQGECTVKHSDKNGALSFGDKVVWLQTAWMSASDLAWWNMSTWDEDCKDENDCLVNRMRDVIDKVKKKTDGYGSPAPGKDIDWKVIVPELIKTGVDLISALLPVDEQDEHLGEASFLEDHQTLWGMKTAIAPRIEAKHENITYRLRGQWFVSRSVVR